jgi:hypothetical protein
MAILELQVTDKSAHLERWGFGFSCAWDWHRKGHWVYANPNRWMLGHGQDQWRFWCAMQPLAGWKLWSTATRQQLPYF